MNNWEEKFKDNLLSVLYREDQCRVPAGSPGGGQFASCGPGGAGVGEWKVTNSALQAEAQLQAMGVKWVENSAVGPKVPRQTRDLFFTRKLNVVGETLQQAIDDRPALGEVLSENFQPVAITIQGDLEYVHLPFEGPQVSAYYEHYIQAIVLPGGLTKVGDDLSLELGGGRHNVGDGGVKSIVRHELGHWVHDTASYEVREQWDDLYRELSGGGITSLERSAYFSEYISKYAGANSSEAFAECFGAWAHPQYGKAGSDRLPAPIESHLDTIFQNVENWMHDEL